MDVVPDLALSRLLQLFDSAFAIGAFANSSGLETYAQNGLTRDELCEFLAGQLELGFGRLDAAACVLAFGASEAETRALCATLTAWKCVPGLRQTSLKLGKRLLGLSRRLYPDSVDFGLTEPHQAVVVGALGKRLGIDRKCLVLAFLHSSLTAQLTAATRLLALSPEQAQEISTALQPYVLEAADRVLADPEAHLFSATPALDMRAQQQASLYTRLFQS